MGWSFAKFQRVLFFNYFAFRYLAMYKLPSVRRILHGQRVNKTSSHGAPSCLCELDSPQTSVIVPILVAADLIQLVQMHSTLAQSNGLPPPQTRHETAIRWDS